MKKFKNFLFFLYFLCCKTAKEHVDAKWLDKIVIIWATTFLAYIIVCVWNLFFPQISLLSKEYWYQSYIVKNLQSNKEAEAI